MDQDRLSEAIKRRAQDIAQKRIHAFKATVSVGLSALFGGSVPGNISGAKALRALAEDIETSMGSKGWPAAIWANAETEVLDMLMRAYDPLQQVLSATGGNTEGSPEQPTEK